MKYMIHSCNQRQWYVDKYLVPSLYEQGIKKEDVYVYQDKNCEGNLKSWIQSCHLASELWGDNENVWHLQDDVIVCSNFKQRTEELEALDYKVICGFTCKYDDGRGPGEGPTLNHMWYSFPCIRIHTAISKEFALWADIYLWRDNQFGFWHRHKKGDDYIFRVWIESYYPNMKVLNLVPNLIDHIDYLIGGTVVNPQREMTGVDIRSIYWEEPELVEELERRIKNDSDNR